MFAIAAVAKAARSQAMGAPLVQYASDSDQEDQSPAPPAPADFGEDGGDPRAPSGEMDVEQVDSWSAFLGEQEEQNPGAELEVGREDDDVTMAEPVDTEEWFGQGNSDFVGEGEEEEEEEEEDSGDENEVPISRQRSTARSTSPDELPPPPSGDSDTEVRSFPISHLTHAN